MSFRATLSIMLIQGFTMTALAALFSDVTATAVVTGLYALGVLLTFRLRRHLDVQGS